MKENPTGNIGEWGEVYVFFRVLGDCSIFRCDKNLQRLSNLQPLPVLAIHREDSVKGEITYVYQQGKWQIWENDQDSGCSVPAEIGTQEADDLLAAMLALKGQKTKKKDKTPAVCFPKAWKFLQMLHSSSLKAKSLEKRDISLTINDARGAGIMRNGYSIKSFMGQDPTLLNASSRTLFTYEVLGLNPTDIDELNSLKIGNLVKGIQDRGGCIKWASMDEQYESNLLNVDEGMPPIIAALLLEHFSSCGLPQKERLRTVQEATKRLTEINPLNMGKRYELKVKRFLEATALGMVPSKEWDGTEDANGGYIIIKPEGEIVTLHIYERALLRNYLYTHTYFEHPSSRRYDCGQLRTAPDGSIRFNLPLQIRYFYTKG